MTSIKKRETDVLGGGGGFPSERQWDQSVGGGGQEKGTHSGSREMLEKHRLSWQGGAEGNNVGKSVGAG